MNFEEALNMIIDGLSDIEKYDEALEVIKNNNNETDTEYKQKYEELETKYKQRFKEKLSEDKNKEKTGDNKVEKEREKLTVEQIDFSGKNE